MPAKMLELECPGCSELLELDAGFAGGICRCSTCGTLMTVPADPSREGAERLLRPDRPGGKTRRPSRPTAPGASTRTERSARPEAPVRHRTPQPAAPPSPAAPADEDDAEIYTTESGRVIRVDHRAIPTAGKRKVARYATYLVFSAGIALVIAACVVAVIVLIRNPPVAPAGPTVVESFTYDPSINPFTFGKANAMGLPLRERTVIVVDASEASAAWLDAVKQALAAGLVDKASSSQVELIYAAQTGPRPLSYGLEPVNSLQANELAALHSQVVAEGASDLPAAVKQGSAHNPSHLILVTSHRPSAEETAAIEATLRGHADRYVDVVAIDGDIVALDDLASRHGGRYVRLSSQQIERWRAEAEAKTTP